MAPPPFQSPRPSSPWPRPLLHGPSPFKPALPFGHAPFLATPIFAAPPTPVTPPPFPMATPLSDPAPFPLSAPTQTQLFPGPAPFHLAPPTSHWPRPFYLTPPYTFGPASIPLAPPLTHNPSPYYNPAPDPLTPPLSSLAPPPSTGPAPFSSGLAHHPPLPRPLSPVPAPSSISPTLLFWLRPVLSAPPPFALPRPLRSGPAPFLCPRPILSGPAPFSLAPPRSVSAPPSPHGAAPGAVAAGGCADWPILMSDRESSQWSAGGRSSVPLPARGRGFALPVCGCQAVVGALRPVGGASVGGAWRAARLDHGKVRGGA